MATVRRAPFDSPPGAASSARRHRPRPPHRHREHPAACRHASDAAAQVSLGFVQQLRVDKNDGLVAFTLQVPYSVTQRETLNLLHFFAAADDACVPGEGAVQAVVQASRIATCARDTLTVVTGRRCCRWAG